MDWAEARGLEAQVIDLPGPSEAASAPTGRAAFWARVPGTARAGGAVILLSHLDVVPADRAAWQVDPFGGVVKDGAVIGRGALDAKGALVVHLATAVRLANRRRPLERDVIVLSTPDEELGGLAGAARLLRDRPELVAGAEFLLTIGGGITVGPSGIDNAPGLWEVGVAEKTPCWLELRAQGTAGHGAGGSSDSAVDRLLAALTRIRELPRPIHVGPEVASMFAALAPRAAEEDRAGFADLEAALLGDPAFRQRFLSNQTRAALVRDSFAITTLRGSRQINVIPGEAAAGIDARLLPGRSCADFAEATRNATNDQDIQVKVRFTFTSRASTPATPLMDAIRRVAERVDPGALVIPRVGTGASDAHWFREHGLIAYGFVPRRLRPIDSRRIHGPGERITEANLLFGTEVLTSLLEDLR
ncbi:MAG: M20/M25/M40 family metallo-hydrolase [bacterium]|nr:M20/M25/M40 family metallo-hydrolase [bacterium]